MHESRNRPSPRHRLKNHGEGQSWAVSYSDMLMVLLSFFVIFFSTDSGGRAKMILRLTAVGKAAGNAESGTGNGTGAGFGNGSGDGGWRVAGSPGRAPANAENPPAHVSLESLSRYESPFVHRAKISADRDEVLLVFQDNLYGSRGVDLTGDGAVAFDELIRKLNTEFKDQVIVTIIGHTDSVRVGHGRNSVIQNNFDLSSIRATRALERAVQLGFPADSITAKGAAEHDRNTRSLSVMVEAK